MNEKMAWCAERWKKKWLNTRKGEKKLLDIRKKIWIVGKKWKKKDIQGKKIKVGYSKKREKCWIFGIIEKNGQITEMMETKMAERKGKQTEATKEFGKIVKKKKKILKYW